MKKDSLVIDGKNFISSRRASEIAVYSKDYVGQLCREGKLVCRRVNRLWWVDENSIRKHAAETLKSNHTSFRSADAASVQPPSFVQSPRINPSTKSADAVIAAGVAAGIPMGMAKNSVENLIKAETAGQSAAVTYALFPRRIFAVGFVLAIVLVFGTAWMSVSIWKGSGSSAPQGQNISASVWDGLNGVFNNIASFMVQRSLSSLGLPQNGSSKITALNNSSSNANNGPTESAADLRAPHAGLVVVPSQSSSTDAKLAEAITNSFSDNVTVTPGQNGTTGVIKPEFRTVAGHDFLYVLVPVKTASTTRN
jgi:hypothetical protein